MANLEIKGKLNAETTGDDLNKRIFDLIYPVGSIYLAIDNSRSPEILFGGTWEQLESGYALWCTNTGNGEKISAGLPNIKGNLYRALWNASSGSGCFKNVRNDTQFAIGGSNKYYKQAVDFDANEGATIKGIYKNDCTTVQPPAIRICAWKKTA